MRIQSRFRVFGAVFHFEKKTKVEKKFHSSTGGGQTRALPSQREVGFSRSELWLFHLRTGDLGYRSFDGRLQVKFFCGGSTGR